MQVTFAYLMKEISDESNTENTLQSTHRNGGGKKSETELSLYTFTNHM
jgi:hypothetical protein